MTLISTHPHQHPIRQWFIGWLVWLALGASFIAAFVLLGVAVRYQLPLVAFMAFFLGGLVLPLLLLTSLHPAIEVHEEGLRLMPLIWKPQLIPWEALLYRTRHTLLKPAPPPRARFKPKFVHAGWMIVMQDGAWHYRVVGWLAGCGMRPVFAVANHSHVNYAELLKAIEAHVHVQEQTQA